MILRCVNFFSGNNSLFFQKTAKKEEFFIVFQRQQIESSVVFRKTEEKKLKCFFFLSFSIKTAENIFFCRSHLHHGILVHGARIIYSYVELMIMVASHIAASNHLRKEHKPEKILPAACTLQPS